MLQAFLHLVRDDGVDLWVNPAHIIWIRRSTNYDVQRGLVRTTENTTLGLTDGQVAVQDPPDEIESRLDRIAHWQADLVNNQ
jgi:hypothetical protein